MKNLENLIEKLGSATRQLDIDRCADWLGCSLRDTDFEMKDLKTLIKNVGGATRQLDIDWHADCDLDAD